MTAEAHTSPASFFGSHECWSVDLSARRVTAYRSLALSEDKRLVEPGSLEDQLKTGSPMDTSSRSLGGPPDPRDKRQTIPVDAHMRYAMPSKLNPQFIGQRVNARMNEQGEEVMVEAPVAKRVGWGVERSDKDGEDEPRPSG